jgi:Icc protein
MTGAATEVLRLIQVTDTHLFADPQGRLMGVNTEQTLAGLLTRIRDDGERPDAVLATGDLAQDGSAEAYRRVATQLAGLEAPVYWLPGNHDCPDTMRKHFAGSWIMAEHAFRARGWQAILLDSAVAGEIGGHLGRGELERLEDRLSAHPDDHALVCLHHHPVVVGTGWLDCLGLDNPEDFFEVVDRYPQVRAVLWGHVHQAFDATRRGVRLMATPSTCFQFLPGSREFAVDSGPPAYRWLELSPGGEIRTEVRHVEGLDTGLDASATGY